jgi:protein-disulfide isomerase
MMAAAAAFGQEAPQTIVPPPTDNAEAGPAAAPAGEPALDDTTALPVRRGQSPQAKPSAAPAAQEPSATAPHATPSSQPKSQSASGDKEPAPAGKRTTQAATPKRQTPQEPAASARSATTPSGKGRTAAQGITAQSADQVFAQLSVGNREAPFVLFLYGDLQCPDSAAFESQMLPQLRRDYIDTGRVRLEARAMPLSVHEDAVQAEAAARCAGEQGGYWQMRQRILAAQSDLGDPALVAHARALGLDEKRFEKSLKSGLWQEQVAQEKAQSAASGVERTPTLILARVQGDGSLAPVWSGAEPRDYRALRRQLDRAMRGRRLFPF